MDDLYKLKNDCLRNLCHKNRIKYSVKDSKRELVKKIIEQKGGRFYKCMKGKEIDFIESRNNPQNNTTKKYSGSNWICKETGLTDEKNKEGCSLKLKPNMKCMPCWNKDLEKRPKECRTCVSGKMVYYCKKI